MSTPETPTAVAEAAESPSKNGLGTKLQLAVIVLTGVVTIGAAVAGDPDTAQLTGVLGAVATFLVSAGKYAQAAVKIYATARPILESRPVASGFARLADVAAPVEPRVAQSDDAYDEPSAAAPSQALVPPESEEYSGADYPPADDEVDVPDEVEFASPPPPADEGEYDDPEQVDVDDVLPVSVPDFAEQPGETERPESGVVPDAPAPADPASDSPSA